MTKQHEQRDLEEVTKAPEAVIDGEEGLEASVAGMEKVKEMAKSGAGEDLPAGGQQDDGGATQDDDDDEFVDDRELMKQRLLKIAPPEPEMRKEIERVLEERKDKLESDIKRHKRKKNYHSLSIAVMQLRLVMRQLKVLAKAGYEKLKGMWLNIVHKMA